jgi:CheY-like chemotaxis protein
MNKEFIHLLVIDDNEDLLFVLKAMLQFTGYKVSTRGNVDNLEHFIEQLSPDIILMDMILAGADGCELCRQIKGSDRISYIPIIMLSAMPQAEETCRAAGADHFIAKPFEMDHLLQTVSIAGIEKPAGTINLS